MNYREFVERLRQAPLNYTIPTLEETVPRRYQDYYGYDSYVGMISFYGIGYQNPVLQPAFTLRWRTGGVSGGSCYGTRPDTPVEGEPEPEWTDLDNTLMVFCPNVSWLHYKRIMALAEVRDTSDGGDYYGNHYTYRVKVLPVQKLWEYLSEKNLLPESNG